MIAWENCKITLCHGANTIYACIKKKSRCQPSIPRTCLTLKLRAFFASSFVMRWSCIVLYCSWIFFIANKVVMMNAFWCNLNFEYIGKKMIEFEWFVVAKRNLFIYFGEQTNKPFTNASWLVDTYFFLLHSIIINSNSNKIKSNDAVAID